MTLNSVFSFGFFLPSICLVSCYKRVRKTVLNLFTAESSREASGRIFTLYFNFMFWFFSAKWPFETRACCFCLRPSLRSTFYFVTGSLVPCFPSEDQLACDPEQYLFLPSACSVSISVFFWKL